MDESSPFLWMGRLRCLRSLKPSLWRAPKLHRAGTQLFLGPKTPQVPRGGAAVLAEGSMLQRPWFTDKALLQALEGYSKLWFSLLFYSFWDSDS